MSGGRRAHFVARGRQYVLAYEWDLPGDTRGYARVEAERAVELLAALPANTARHPGLAALLGVAGLGQSSIASGRPRMRGLVLLEHAPWRAQGEAPPEVEVPEEVIEWRPPPEPAKVVELRAQATIAATLLAAAANGAPFCEMCENCS